MSRRSERIVLRSPQPGKKGTHSKIYAYGPTYERLAASPTYRKELMKEMRRSVAKRSAAKRSAYRKKTVSPLFDFTAKEAKKHRGVQRMIRKMPGCSSYGRYPEVDEDDFCGPEGGACPETFPVNTYKRYRAALSYARDAPNPEGIVRCAQRKAIEKGWLDTPKKLERAKKELEKFLSPRRRY
jgi:hypothetical protein